MNENKTAACDISLDLSFDRAQIVRFQDAGLLQEGDPQEVMADHMERILRDEYTRLKGDLVFAVRRR